MTPVLLIVGAVIAALVLGMAIGWQMRKDHNIELYVDEQNKRVKAECERDEKQREVVRAWHIIRTSDSDALKRERTINGLLAELEKYQRQMLRSGKVGAA